jgi:hypothetical protein
MSSSAIDVQVEAGRREGARIPDWSRYLSASSIPIRRLWTDLAVLAIHAGFGDLPEPSERPGDIFRLGFDEFINFQPSYLDRRGCSLDMPNEQAVGLRLVGCT